MSPIFNFHRKYPKALTDLARSTDRLAEAENKIARAMLESMKEQDDEPVANPPAQPAPKRKILTSSATNK